MEIKLIHSLEKILRNHEPMLTEENGIMLANEVYHFQIAILLDGSSTLHGCRVVMEGALTPFITLRDEGYVSCATASEFRDDGYINDGYGVFPDILRPFGNLGLVLRSREWHAVWVTVGAGKPIPPGKYETTFHILKKDGTLLGSVRHKLKVLRIRLPETDLRITDWIHYDCIAARHDVRVFSRPFYRIFRQYLRSYICEGNTMLYVPLFTPPLDTEVGTERMTVQLVDVYEEDGGYRFGFDKLRRFIRFALKEGVRYFEFSHLITQWGGKACPKIEIHTANGVKNMFGWDVPSDDLRYFRFLDAFLPALVREIQELGIADVSYFHLTDEPTEKSVDIYKKCRELLKLHIGDLPIMDALGVYTFYEEGLVDTPVPSIDVFPRFRDNKVSEMLVYNCLGQAGHNLTNRFIAMPSYRTRILGMMLYRAEVAGYLHWGYNFYNSALSLEKNLDPYAVNDAGGAFPPGDAFIVYPTADGVLSSLRYETVRDGYQDYRALMLLASAVGKPRVFSMLDDFGVRNFNEYPDAPACFIKFRETIYHEIESVYSKK